MFNNKKKSETTNTFNGKLSAVIAEYFASLKHDVLVAINSEENYLSKNEYTEHNLNTLNGLHVLDVHESSALSQLYMIDEYVNNFNYTTASFEQLEGIIDIIFKDFSFAFQGTHQNLAKSRMLKLLKILSNQPEAIKRIFAPIGYQLVDAYSFESNRLMDVNGVSEFAEFLGWDKRKLSSYISKGITPKPYKKLSSTPLWTLGQMESFGEVIKSREYGFSKGKSDWETHLVLTKVEFEMRSHGLYELREDSHDFSISYKLVDLNLSPKEEIEFLTILNELHGDALWIKTFIVNKYYMLDMKDKAIVLCKSIVDKFSKYIPEDIEGRLTCDNYEYHAISYKSLVYMLYESGKIKEAEIKARDLSRLYVESIEEISLIMTIEDDTLDNFNSWLESIC